MITALAMEKKFQLNQSSQTLEHSRLGQEALRHLCHQILAAQGTDPGVKPRGGHAAIGGLRRAGNTRGK
jgi:hypothetical protein